MSKFIAVYNNPEDYPIVFSCKPKEVKEIERSYLERTDVKIYVSLPGRIVAYLDKLRINAEQALIQNVKKANFGKMCAILHLSPNANFEDMFSKNECLETLVVGNKSHTFVFKNCV